MEKTIFETIFDLMPGVYETWAGFGDDEANIFIYRKPHAALIVSFHKSGTETIMYVDSEEYMKNFLLTNKILNCRYYDIYDAYKRVLGNTDEILGVRGVLIKPEDIGKYVYVDDFDNIKVLK